MTSYHQAVDSWAEHLRSGGTTTWSTWLSDVGPPDGTANPGGPSAAHLEVARRLNALTGAAHPALVDLVLHAPPTGRGLVDPPLPWPGGARFGTPATEPDRLPTPELLRIAVPVLAGLLPGVPPGAMAPTRRPRAWPWRGSVRVTGSRLTAAAVRAGLGEQGVPTSRRRRATHLVVARPLEVMMAEHWHARSLRGGAAKWWRIWRRALAVDELPRSVQPDLLAARRSGSGREVHVVVAATDDRLTDLVADAVGHRVTLPPAPDTAETDLLRLINPVLALTAGPDRRALVAVLERRVLPDARGSLTTAPAPLAVPPWARAWADDRAREMADRIRHGGYAVHGDPDDLVPTDRPGASSSVDRDRTLELALAAGVRAWQLQGGTR